MFIEFLQVFLPLVIYVLLIIILVIGIIIGVRIIKTLDKVDDVVDSVSTKVNSLNGIFSIIDNTTDRIVSITDKVVEGVSGVIGRLFWKKKTKEVKELED